MNKTNADVKLELGLVNGVRKTVGMKIREIPRKEGEYGKGHYVNVEFSNGFTESYDYRYEPDYNFVKVVFEIVRMTYEPWMISMKVDFGKAEVEGDE